MYAKGVQKSGMESLQSVALYFTIKNQLFTMIASVLERDGSLAERCGRYEVPRCINSAGQCLLSEGERT